MNTRWIGIVVFSFLPTSMCLLSQQRLSNLCLSSTRRTFLASTTRADERIDEVPSRRIGEPDFAREVVLGRPPKNSRRRERNTTVPAVDSTLLRFLSEEKRQWDQETRLPPQPSQQSSLNSTTQNLPNSSIEEDVYVAITTESNLNALNVSQFQGGLTTKILTAANSTESSLGQFNSNRVAQLLVSLEVNETLAWTAGVSVQQHVVASTATRRVRQFLKRRDSSWANGYPTQSEIRKKDEELVRDLWKERSYHKIEDTFRVLTEFGLTGTDIAIILRHTPGVVLMTPRRPPTNAPSTSDDQDAPRFEGEPLEETMKRAYDQVLLGLLRLQNHTARQVLRVTPGLLTLRGSKQAEQLLVLLTTLGLPPGKIAKDTYRNGLPKLLSRSPSEMFRLVSFLSSDAVRMSMDNIRLLLQKKNCIQLLDAAVPPQDKGGRVQRREQVDEVYRRMSQTAWALRHEIGTEDLGRLIGSYPRILLLDAEAQIIPVARYLIDDLRIWKDDLPRVLRLHPFLIGLKMEKMKSVVSYLKYLEVSEENLPSILRAFPSLLTLDIERDIVPVVDFLREIGVSDVGRFITRLPPVLSYSVENELRPKWEYLSQVCLYPSFELSAFPAFFSYPLEKIVKTRYEYLQVVKRVPTQLLALDLIVRHGNKDFAMMVAKDTDGGATFARFIEHRRKWKEKQTGAPATKRRRRSKRRRSKQRRRQQGLF